ncbi:MAG: hypothetical protein GY816_13760 [Cytophagales bacterium]|nr:hypothetical protein [Cytophagales bacterium]
MDASFINTVLLSVPSYLEIQNSWSGLRNGQITILLVNSSHWITVLAVDNRLIYFDSRPIQGQNTCGVFSIIYVLAYSLGGLNFLRTISSQFSSDSISENDMLAIETVQEWIDVNYCL